MHVGVHADADHLAGPRQRAVHQPRRAAGLRHDGVEQDRRVVAPDRAIDRRQDVGVGIDAGRAACRRSCRRRRRGSRWPDRQRARRCTNRCRGRCRARLRRRAPSVHRRPPSCWRCERARSRRRRDPAGATRTPAAPPPRPAPRAPARSRTPSSQRRPATLTKPAGEVGRVAHPQAAVGAVADPDPEPFRSALVGRRHGRRVACGPQHRGADLAVRGSRHAGDGLPRRIGSDRIGRALVQAAGRRGDDDAAVRAARKAIDDVVDQVLGFALPGIEQGTRQRLVGDEDAEAVLAVSRTPFAHLVRLAGAHEHELVAGGWIAPQHMQRRARVAMRRPLDVGDVGAGQTGDRLPVPAAVDRWPRRRRCADAAYARSPPGCTQTALTRPVTRGAPSACPPSSTLGPSGCQSSVSVVGKARGRAPVAARGRGVAVAAAASRNSVRASASAVPERRRAL